MIRRKTTLRSKSGGFSAQNGNGNGNPRALVDEIVYREHWNFLNATIPTSHWDPQYSGWTNPSRPRDYAIFQRCSIPVGGPIVPPVNLGTAGNFAILAESTITNVPTSVITGDMGLSPAAASAPNTGITGFATTLDGSGQFLTSAQVTGKLYAANLSAPTPAKMTLAISDMMAAYTAAQDLVATHPSNFAAGLLGGQTLTPGVWNWTESAVTVNGGNLILNGAGVYVLQIAGTFDLFSGLSITLAGGATAANVFWAIAGEATLHSGSTFNGELLGGSGIATQAGAVVNGRLLAQTAVTLISSTVTET